MVSIDSSDVIDAEDGRTSESSFLDILFVFFDKMSNGDRLLKSMMCCKVTWILLCGFCRAVLLVRPLYVDLASIWPVQSELASVSGCLCALLCFDGLGCANQLICSPMAQDPGLLVPPIPECLKSWASGGRVLAS